MRYLFARSAFLVLFLSALSYAEPVIDVVYTWVDGSDLDWQASLNAYRSQAGAAPVASRARFRSRDELRYSLRSLNAFAPWVNHIYIVTCGQRPKWLKEDPKITLISHKEIFLNPDHLPTFNSMAIECHLHRIPGLQEHYLYFNDDVFLGKECSPSTFFSKKGKMHLFTIDQTFPTDPVKAGEEGFIAGLKNTGALMAARYGAKAQPRHAHTPFAERKSFVSRVAMQFPSIFSQVSSHRFRAIDDYAITNGLIPLMALQMGQGEKVNEKHTTVGFGKELKKNTHELHELFSERPRFFCIQDSSNDESPEASSILHGFFEAYFPQPAPWEDPLFPPPKPSESLKKNFLRHNR